MSDQEFDSLVARYQRDGYVFPIDIFDREEISRHLGALHQFETRVAGMSLGNKGQLNFPHVVSRFANDIVRDSRVLDIIESIIGPDILLWGSTFFFKEPHTENFVSWHQDMRYWGLPDPDALVSAWLALGPVNQENGCMRFVPGSHKNALLAHRDTYSNDNILTRGQEADIEINEDAVAYVELEPGQMSLHHGYLLHASMPNRSSERRLGFTMNFIAPHNRQQVAGIDYAMLLRGEDRFGYFEPVPGPTEDLSEDALSWHAKILSAQNEAMYEGAAVNAT